MNHNKCFRCNSGSSSFQQEILETNSLGKTEWQWHLEHSAPSLSSSGKPLFIMILWIIHMAFTALKSTRGFTLLLFFHDCILNRTSWSELAWIPDRNSPRTWNNLGWTSGDHLFQPLLDCLPLHYSYASKLLHCCDTLCTKHSMQRNCHVRQGNLRGLMFACLNQISHFSKLEGSCFFSTSTSP